MTTETPPRLIKVALPAEHGGWSLTLEPVLLGLIVAPSWAGGALGLVALLGFVARTPFKLAAGDRLRGRRMPRTVLAERVLLVEALLIVALLAVAVALAEAAFWQPLAIAVPLLAVETWYDIRSKSRHLVPELAGTIAIGSIAAAIALAGGSAMLLAIGLWVVAAARAVATIPFVRVQLRRAKDQPYRIASSDLAQIAAVAAVAVGVVVGAVSAAGAGAIVLLALIQAVLSRRPPPRAAVLGSQQVVLGLGVVVIAALGALAP